MNNVRDILRRKGDQVWSVEPTGTVYDALQLMAEKNIGAVMVLEDGFPIGIFTERHYSREVALKGKRSQDVPVRDVMAERVICVDPRRTIEECMALMAGRHIRHLPVMDEGQLIGIVSIGDVVAAIISEREFVIEQLESYIRGR